MKITLSPLTGWQVNGNQLRGLAYGMAEPSKAGRHDWSSGYKGDRNAQTE